MAYATYIPHTRRSHSTFGSFFAYMNIFDTGMIVRIGIICIALLGFLYVSETNALMFMERTMPTKERTVLEVKNDVRTLEIQATRLAASHTVQEAAMSNAMVLPHDVSYVSGSDSTVAMALPVTR